jgi:hypothetical protein
MMAIGLKRTLTAIASSFQLPVSSLSLELLVTGDADSWELP